MFPGIRLVTLDSAQLPKDFLPLILKSMIILSCAFKWVCYPFWLNICVRGEVYGEAYCFAYECPIAPFIERKCYPSLNYFCTFVKNQLSIFVWAYSCFPGSSIGKGSTCKAGDLGSIPGLGRSPGEEKGDPLQYSGLENSRDYTVYGVAKSRTRLSNFRFTSLHSYSWVPYSVPLIFVSMFLLIPHIFTNVVF